MRRRRIRTKRAPHGRNRLVEAGMAALVLLFAALFVLGRVGRGCMERGLSTTEGQVLDVRVVLDHTRESLYGGLIFYRAEVRVSYRLHGQPQDRWLPASEATTDRLMLETLLADRPKTCEVFWAPRHSETPRCRLK